jgi:hypothetical protein
MAGITLVNAAPLDLTATLTYTDAGGKTIQQTEAVPLPSLYTVPCDLPHALPPSEVETISVALRSPTGVDIGHFELRPADPPLIITADGLQPAGLKQRNAALKTLPSSGFEWKGDRWEWVFKGVGLGPWTRFVNNTDLHVDLYYRDIAEDGAIIHGRLLSLPPRARHEGNYTRPVWIARAAFSDELLAMSLVTESGLHDMTISTAFRDKKRDKKEQWLPSPVREIPTMYLVGQEPRDGAAAQDIVKVDPTSRDYIVTSELDSLSREQFNTRNNVTTRSLRISGVELTSKDYPLNLYRGESGENVLDLVSLEIYADRIVISSVLRFPGTDVTIYARELEFKSGGKIDTTPLQFKFPAMTPPEKREKEGRPKDYVAADGQGGEKGGDIKVFVSKLTVPPQEASEVRFVSRGSNGQEAEKGDLKPYKQGHPDQPKDEESKDIPSVTRLWIEQRLETHCDAWRWPGEVRDPDKIRWNSKQLFGTPDARTGPGGEIIVHAGASNVSSLKVDAHDGRALAWLPALPGVKMNKSTSFSWPPDNSPTCPGNGEDAYAGGAPGNGGASGTIRTCLPLDSFGARCDITPGDPGPETPAVQGKQKGKPDPAYSVEMKIVYYDSVVASPQEPRLQVKAFEARDGYGASAKKAQAGGKGSIVHDPRSWMHVDVVDAVLGCAKDAYRKEDRALASKLLEPYYGELRDTQDSELKGRLAVIEAIRGKLLRNLDYYGKPPGWVPRLNLKSTFQIFQTVQSISSSLLYYALNMEDNYARLQNANDLARETADAVGAEMDYSTNRLKDACTDLARAREELHTVQDQVNQKQAEIDLLKAWTTQEAKNKVQAQRVFRGVIKTIGGLMKAVPLGQPYIGLAGDITAGVGDFNWNDPAGLTHQISGCLTSIGNTTDKFLKDNKDLILKDSVPDEVRRKLELDQEASTNLEYELAKHKGGVAAQEDEVKQAQEKKAREWNTNKKQEMEQLKTDLNAALVAIEKDEQLGKLTPDDQAKKLAEIAGMKAWSNREGAELLRIRKEFLEERIKSIGSEEAKAKQTNDEAQLTMLNIEKSILAEIK